MYVGQNCLAAMPVEKGMYHRQDRMRPLLIEIHEEGHTVRNRSNQWLHKMGHLKKKQRTPKKTRAGSEDAVPQQNWSNDLIGHMTVGGCLGM